MSVLVRGGGGSDARLDQARDAARGGDWAAARRLFETVAAGPEPSAEVLAGLGVTLRATGDFQLACGVLERAFVAFLDAGDRLGAIRVAICLVGQRQGLGEKSAAKGWEQRALRILDEVGACPERGYLAVARTGCEFEEPRELAERAGIAYEAARQFGDRELELRALGERGLALVCQGDVDAGFALLDEMMVSIASGEILDIETRGKAVCAMLSACERTGDAGRGEYWIRQIEANAHLQHPITEVHCQIVQGTVDAMCGRWDAAEERLAEAIRLPVTTGYHNANSRSRLAAIRLQQGRYDEAADLLSGIEDNVEAAQTLARLHMARGRPHDAAVLLRTVARALRHDCMRVAPALALLVEVELLCGDRSAAAKAANELAALEDTCSSNEIRALARLALARLATAGGDHEAALEELETSLALLTHLDRPLLAAQTRLEMARVLAAARHYVTARAEAAEALRIFHRLGVTRERVSAEHLVEELDRVPAPATTAAARSVDALTPREAEVAELVCSGMSNRDIAGRLRVSVRTVETHVDRVLGKLGCRSRTQLAARRTAPT